MSTILALETSTPTGSVALLRDDAVLFEASFSSDRSHNSLLFEPLGRALALAVPEIIAVGTGPGSYSGVRVSIAAALGLSLAHGVPVVGWPTLSAFDAPERCLMVGDARRGSCFLAELVGGVLVGEPELLATGDLAARLTLPAFTFDAAPVAHASQVVPSAAWLARRVAILPAEHLADLAKISPEPMYLRAPHITTPRPRLT